MRLTGSFENESTSRQRPPPDARRMPEGAEPRDSDTTEWPAQVEMILSAMDAAKSPFIGNRRRHDRETFRTRAELRLFAQMPLLEPAILFSRDLHAGGMGFITQERLPLGYSGLIEFTTPGGRTLAIQCTVNRCREAVNGWFEGALHFARDQKID